MLVTGGRGGRLSEQHGCLFCRGSDGGFSTREHIFPESIGNTEMILPAGVVCDQCNNGSLSELDQAICDFLPVTIRRTMLGIRSKAGKIPVARFSEGTIERVPTLGDAEPTLAFRSAGTRGLLRESESLPDGRVALTWRSTGGRRMTSRYASKLSRAVLKSALECAWLDHGPMMLEPRFDHIREAVLGRPRDGFFAILANADPNGGQVSLTYDLASDGDRSRMWVVANYFGVYVATDSRLARPEGDLPEGQVNLITFRQPDRRAP